LYIAVVIRLGLTPRTVEVVANQIKNLAPQKERPLLITDYIRPGEAESLKHNKVEFIDTAGNVYLNQPPLYVDIIGRKKPEKPLRAKRAFQKTGLKLIYLLLKQPQVIKRIKLADPLLIHAELLGGNSERLLKIAELIFNKYLAPRIDRGQPE
jgi:hypothetical protein